MIFAEFMSALPMLLCSQHVAVCRPPLHSESWAEDELRARLDAVNCFFVLHAVKLLLFFIVRLQLPVGAVLQANLSPPALLCGAADCRSCTPHRGRS